MMSGLKFSFDLIKDFSKAQIDFIEEYKKEF
jgi:hypothetical protein